jgi:hypothetical protein
MSMIAIFDPMAPDLMEQLDDLDRLGQFIRGATEGQLKQFLVQMPDPDTHNRVLDRLMRATRRNGHPPMTKDMLRSSIPALAVQYLQIGCVVLLDNGLQDECHPDIDLYVAMWLREECYDVITVVDDVYDTCWEQSFPRDKIEQLIAYDRTLREGGVYVTFVRPVGPPGFWTFGPDEPTPRTMRHWGTDSSGFLVEREGDPDREWIGGPEPPDDAPWEEWAYEIHGSLLTDYKSWRQALYQGEEIYPRSRPSHDTRWDNWFEV